MRREETNIVKNFDWTTLFIYLSLLLIGWMSVYSSIQTPDDPVDIFHGDSGKQLLTIGLCLMTIILILLIDYKVLYSIPYLVYGLCIIGLFLVLTPLGHEVNGNKSWVRILGMNWQPSEFAKLGLSLAFAKYVSDKPMRYILNKRFFNLLFLVLLPPILILAQPDAGSALVFSGFVVVMYLDGLTPFILIAGLISIVLFVSTLVFSWIWVLIILLLVFIAIMAFTYKNKNHLLLTAASFVFCLFVIFGTDFAFFKILKPHQRARIEVLINDDIDKEASGVRYQMYWGNLTIGSGGIWGKGYLEGTIKEYVPESHSDYIYSIVGEEKGFIGSSLVLALYTYLLVHLIAISRRQKSKFAKIYGYCIVSILFIHYLVNISMVLSLFPVIGIPLPLLSYGGSSLWSFTIMIFIFLKLDMHRNQILARD